MAYWELREQERLFLSAKHIESSINEKLLAELDSDKGIGLIERVKRGLGKPAIIYVKSFLIRKEPGDSHTAGISGNQTSESRSPEYGNAEVQTSEKPKSGLRETRPN